MEQSIDRRPEVIVEDDTTAPEAGQSIRQSDSRREARLTRRVHVVLGLVVAALGAWLLYRSRTELAFRGPNNEPGPGLPSRPVDACLIGLGLSPVGGLAARSQGQKRRGADTLAATPADGPRISGVARPGCLRVAHRAAWAFFWRVRFSFCS